jgi:hypothetical protein
MRFGLLSSAHQFEALATEVEKDSPMKGAVMREWSAAAQEAMLKWLSDVTQERLNPTNRVELWRVCKVGRELTCVVMYLSTGVDVRLMEGNDFRRTKLVRDGPEAEALAKVWKTKLTENGWT